VTPVAFGSVVGTQLAQALGLAWADGRLNAAITTAVAGSAATMALAMASPGPRQCLGLRAVSPAAALLCLGASLAAPVLARLLSRGAL
jgi:hypothetical protein